MVTKMWMNIGLMAVSGAVAAWAAEPGAVKSVDSSKGMPPVPAGIQAPSEAGASKERLAAPTDTNAVIVTVNGKSLTMGMINWMQPNAEPIVIKSIADFWVMTQLLNDEAVKRNIPASPKAKFLVELSTMQAYGREVMQQVQEAATVTDAEVEEHYNKVKDTDQRTKDQVRKELEYRAKSKAAQDFMASMKERAAAGVKKSDFLLEAEKLTPPGMGGPGPMGGAPRQMPPQGMRSAQPPPPPPPSAPAK